MSIENAPEEPKDIINFAAKAEYLKTETEFGKIKLNSYNSIELHPKGTIFGAKIKVEKNGDITPSLIFDTKKINEPKKDIDIRKMLEDAINDFLEQ